MMLPNAHLAVVEQEKVTGYLFNAEHAHGKSKARFFNQFGFTLPDWETLAKALRARAGSSGEQNEGHFLRIAI